MSQKPPPRPATPKPPPGPKPHKPLGSGRLLLGIALDLPLMMLPALVFIGYVNLTAWSERWI